MSWYSRGPQDEKCVTALEAGASPHCKLCLPTDVPICSRLPAPDVSVPGVDCRNFEWRLASFGNRSTGESVLAVKGGTAGLLPASAAWEPRGRAEGHQPGAENRELPQSPMDAVQAREAGSHSVWALVIWLSYPDYILFSLGHTGHPWVHSPWD